MNTNYVNDIISTTFTQLLNLKTVQQSPTLKERLNQLQIKNRRSEFLLVILGQFKRGKTSLINAFLGEPFLPTALVPLTSVITIIKPGRKSAITVQFKTGKSLKISHTQLTAYVTEVGNPHNEKQVDRVVIEHTHTNWLKDVTLIDTPGVGSVYKHNTDVAYEYVPQADAGLFVLSPDPPISEAELHFLTSMKDYLSKIIFIQNKIDQVEAGEQQESLAFTQQVIQTALGIDTVVIYPVSAKLGLKGKTDKNIDVLTKSGLPQLESQLEQLISSSKKELIDLSHQKKLRLLLHDIDIQLNIRQQTATLSLAELHQKVARFQDQVRSIREAKADAAAIIQTNIEKLVDQTLFDDLELFKTQTLPLLITEFEDFYDKQRHLPNKTFVECFNDFLEERIKTTFSSWRQTELSHVKTILQSTLGRFTEETNQSITELTSLSESLFQVNLGEMNVSIDLDQKANFVFAFDEYQVNLDLFTPTVSRLPSLIAKKLLYPKLKERLTREFDRHCGRSRFDFRERILEEVRRYQNDLNERFDQLLSLLEEGTALTLKAKETQTEDVTLLESVLATEQHAVSKMLNQISESIKSVNTS